MPAVDPHRSRQVLIVAFAAFVFLGLPEGVLGTAWPSIGSTFDRPLGDLGWLVAAYTSGYLAASLTAGRQIEWLGAGSSLVAAVVVTTVGLTGFALAPGWPLVIGAALVLGLGGGALDSGMNTHVARSHGPRAMHVLHGFFGVGATLGPLVVSATLDAGASWRWVYGLLAVAELGIVVTILRSRRGLSQASDTHTSVSGTARFGPVLVGTLAMFFLYVGVEVSLGSWSFSLLSEARGLDRTAAAIAVAGFWAGLSGGRFGLALAGRRLHPSTLLRVAVPAAVLCCLWVWLAPRGWDALGLPVAGLALAGIFPALMLLTPRWLGTERLGHVVGYQLAASSSGGIVIPGAIGILVNASDLEVVGPVVSLVAAAMIVCMTLLHRAAHPVGTSSSS